MTTNKQTPTTTKAAPVTPAEVKQEPVTKLADVNDPAKLTDTKIDEIAGEHSDPTDPEQAANIDVAEALEAERDEAKSDDEPVRGYFHGQGGAAGI